MSNETAVSTPTRDQLHHGIDRPHPAVYELHAGPVTALLEDGDLRRVRIGDVEIVQRVYVAVRDEVWNTIPAVLSDLRVDARDDRFDVTFTAHHRYRAIDYRWTARITGDPDGTISYAMDGVALSAFRHAKIGLNIHHGLPGSVGRPYRAWTPGGEITGTLPTLIEPQRNDNGRLTALFPEYERLQITLPDGGVVDLGFEGDLFEMQDHRNWTDANLKSYGTPLSVPWPMDAVAGQRFHQRVTIRAEGVHGSSPTAVAADRARVVMGAPRGVLPLIGFGMPSDRIGISSRERDLLRALRPDHLRADLPLDGDWRERLAEARLAAAGLDTALELAVFVPPDRPELFDDLAAALRAEPVRVARVLVFSGGSGFGVGGGSTPGQVMHEAHTRLVAALPGVPVVGGTNQFFAELNRDHPDAGAMDGIVYSLNPQVHAADDRSLMENVQGQADTVATLRSYAMGRPIHVSPVTLIGRAGPFPGGPPPDGGLPGNVDARQMSLFAAAFTVGSLRHLAESGVASVTWYELAGWRGLVERESGAPHRDFPSVPEMVFPLCDVFAFIAERDGAELLQVHTPDEEVEAFAVRTRDGRRRVMVANLTPHPRQVSLGSFQPGAVSVAMLDDTGVAAALLELRLDPAREVSTAEGGVDLELGPYAVAFVTEVEA